MSEVDYGLTDEERARADRLTDTQRSLLRDCLHRYEVPLGRSYGNCFNGGALSGFVYVVGQRKRCGVATALGRKAAVYLGVSNA